MYTCIGSSYYLLCNDIVVFYFVWLLGGVCGAVFLLHCGIEQVRVHGGSCGTMLGGVRSAVFLLHCGIEQVRVHGGSCGAIAFI